MKNYGDLIISECMLLCSDQEYLDKKKLRKHNQAMTRLNKLAYEMYSEPDRCADLALQLLSHEKEVVQAHMAWYCLAAQIHQDLAKQVLVHIIQHSSDDMLVLNANGTLRYTKSFDEMGEPGSNRAWP